jgi:cytochrome P450 family 9
MLLITLIILGTVLFSIYIVRIFSENVNYWRKKGVKYVKPLPLLGNMLPVVTGSQSFWTILLDVYRAFPNERYFGFFQFMTPVLIVRDPELIKSITIKNFENFVDHTGFLSSEADPIWGKNLFASEGERWKDLRQSLSPVFTSSKMRNMFILMDECAKQLVDYFKDKNQDITEVELKNVFTRYTNDTIATAAFGIKCDSFKDQNNEFLLKGYELSNFTGLNRFKFFLYGNFPKIASFFKLKIIEDRVANFFRSVVEETINLRIEKNIVRPDLIHFLILARKGKLKHEDYQNLPEAGFAAVKESNWGKSDDKVNFMSNEDITAQAVVFFLGGFDTASSLMAFAGLELALNPGIQRKLKDEIIRTHQECDGKITYEKLLSMKYLDMVISESLRKWPQAGFIDRKCTKTFTIEPEREGESPLTINKGDVCWIPVYALHLDPNYHPNANQFDPERFSDENKDKINGSTYLPFGIGPRNCIGSRFALLESKILLYYLLLEFDFVITSKTQIPIKIRKDSALLLSENGFHVGLKRTENVH